MFRLFYIFLMVLLSFHCSSKDKKNTSSIPVDNKAIAVWAYPDGVSIPYRDDDNLIITGSKAYIGVVAYHATGIARIEFSLNGGTPNVITTETVNPDTTEYEYVFELDPATLSTDGEYTISATAYPNDGDETVLPDLKIQKDNDWHSVLIVESGGTFTTLDEACKAAKGGDIIKVESGTYSLPDQSNYNFTKYVTIMPDVSQTVLITGGSLRSSYIKFKDITFNLSLSASDSVINSQQTHFWFDSCTVIGYGKDKSDNDASAFYFYNDSAYAVIENCNIHDTSLGATISGGNYILRNNTVYDVTADGFGYNGKNILISGNTIHDNHLPAGGDQHCDFISSNTGANQIVIRNNNCYNGDHQGIKLGATHDGVDKPYTNIAIINNLFALGTNGTTNLRLDSAWTGKRYSNIMIEFNTVWNGSPLLLIESDVSARNIYVRNNIFGPTSVADSSGVSGIIINNNCYNLSPSIGDNSITGDPMFTDSMTWDFSLQSGSPCISKGDKTSGVFYDINKAPRGVIPDIGAYENTL